MNRHLHEGKKRKIKSTFVECSRRVREQTRCSKHQQDGVWRFLLRQNKQLRAATCSTVRPCGQEKQTCGVPNGTADGEVWSDGHKGLDFLVYRRTHQWGGSPSNGVCYTPTPDPCAMRDGSTTVDPVLRAVAHTGNAREFYYASRQLLETLCQIDVLLPVR